MMIEIVVASTALLITTLATAIALWECICHRKSPSGSGTYALESIGSENFLSNRSSNFCLRCLGYN